MTFFTDSPFERMMVQRPRKGREKPRAPAPEGHHCHGCARYGEGCVLPCYRNLLPKRKEREL